MDPISLCKDLHQLLLKSQLTPVAIIVIFSPVITLRTLVMIREGGTSPSMRKKKVKSENNMIKESRISCKLEENASKLQDTC